MTDQKRLNRYISQMEAFRRAHYGIGESVQLLSFEEPQQTRFTYSDEQYAWASIDPDKYGGSPQEDAASA
jgi:hypothetical protein